MTINFDIELLRTLIAFADTGSFKEAANLVFRSQPAVSMQMKKLENVSGKQLFTKNGRELTLTDAGIKFVSYARQLMAYHDKMVTDICGEANDVKVRIGIPDDYATLFLPTLFDKIGKRFPNVTLQIKSEGSHALQERLNQGKLDIAILSVTRRKRGDIVLRTDPIVWVTSEETPKHKHRPVPLALFADDSPVDQATLIALQNFKDKHQFFDYNVVLESKSWAALTLAAKSGFAVASMAKSVVTAGLKILDADDGFPELGEVDIVMRSTPDSQSIATSNIAEHIMDEFRDNTPELTVDDHTDKR